MKNYTMNFATTESQENFQKFSKKIKGNQKKNKDNKPSRGGKRF